MKKLLVLSLSLFLLTSCAYIEKCPLFKKASFKKISLKKFSFKKEKAHWGYTGKLAPENWGKLDKKFKACSEGKNQAPIDLSNFIKADLKPLTFAYNATATEIFNNGHTVQANVAKGSSFSLDGKDFELLQFHFHTPSENTIKGKFFPMEAHLVHSDKDGNLAVIAVMYEQESENAVIKSLWEKMPKKVGDKHSLADAAINAFDLLPKDKSYYRFSGSLTTPPCTEGVRWIVMKKPVTISKEQVDEFAHVMHHPNNRPVQPLNSRIILK